MRAKTAIAAAAVLVTASGGLSGCSWCASDSEPNAPGATGAGNAATGKPGAGKAGVIGDKAGATGDKSAKPFPVEDKVIKSMLTELEQTPSDRQGTAVCAMIARAPGLYGPDLASGCRTFVRVTPAERAVVIANALQRPVSDLGCMSVFRSMGTVPPADRSKLFASGCPPAGSALPMNAIAKAAPTGAMMAVIIDAIAQRDGFGDHKLHKAFIDVLLAPQADVTP